MTRKKLNLAYITNDSMRKATFNKRKRGFVKKIHELSVLCGIEACAVIYSPFSSGPEVWPSNSGVKEVVEKFVMLPEIEQEKKMVDHEGFLRQSINKTMENNDKKTKENKERMMKEVMFEFLGGQGDMLSLTDKTREDLCKYIDQYLKELYHHRNQTLTQSQLEYGESSSAADVMAPAAIAEVGPSAFPNPDLNLHLNDNQYQNQFGYPNVSQDGIYNPNQQQEAWLVNQMMNNPEQMCLPMIEDNNRYYLQQP
ncbi:agamous-like MADS-box protein AGL80 isoform X2 [Eutrema salsugineum]|uniref:agamous-like MADS-box protein AGL80 isoform X2 n=1 Tax=Eutrema salsugineum TaxID=72664 RepID=UPI000CED57CE|nr:agamous-like MADS-box protein AGL80 isoform X2 [Eutrema salsugineum]